MTTSPVSRFEELPDEELAPSTSLATDSTAASMAGGPSERPSAFTTDETSDDDDEGEDSWWTPSELRVRPQLRPLELNLLQLARPS